MSERTSSSIRRKHILIVDDERDITESMKSALKAHYWVDMAGNALDALRMFKPHFYDLILLDYRMPQIDGAELYQEIMRLDPRQKICFITAFEELNARIEHLQRKSAGDSIFHEDVTFPVLKKPFDTATLLANISRLIE